MSVPIERLSEPPRDALARLRTTQRPAVLVGAARQWPAISRWTPTYFRERFGELRVRATVNLPAEGVPYLLPAGDHKRELSMAEFITMLESADRACYVDQAPLGGFPGLAEELGIAELGLDGPVNTTNLWFGSAGTRSGLHNDGGDNLIVQVVGRKRVLLVAPEEARNVYPMRMDFTKSAVDPEHPDLSSFPRFEKATVLETTLEPGDALFLPRFWWHHLTSLERAISINHWHGKMPSLFDYAVLIQRSGAVQWVEILRQMIVHGLLRRPTPQRLYVSPITFGERIFRLMTGRGPKPGGSDARG
jgi:hypothetical protein